MHTVTIHKDCKFTPVTLNVKGGDTVDFVFQNSTTIQFSNANFWNPATSSVNSNQTLTVASTPGSGSSTATAPTCLPQSKPYEEHKEGHPQQGGPPASAGDSCVITVSSIGR